MLKILKLLINFWAYLRNLINNELGNQARFFITITCLRFLLIKLCDICSFYFTDSSILLYFSVLYGAFGKGPDFKRSLFKYRGVR
jgi:hypothetical protein